MLVKKLLLGNEAIAMGAIDAGLSVAYGYPGTPSTEIMQFLQNYSKIHGYPLSRWCSNEKVAYESALGVSMVGKRALVIMKNVGLNVAADPFINSSILKINGGLVLVVADDPGMHSSQNEQDSRYYADFAKIICFEPCDQQEAYVMIQEAFTVSERFNLPVMVRVVTRLAHTRSEITLKKRKEENDINQNVDRKDWSVIPEYAKKMYANLLVKQKYFMVYSEKSLFNRLTINENFKDFAVVTAGLGENYYLDNVSDLKEQPSHLHIGVYPIPVIEVRKLAECTNRILIIEEGYPYIERRMRGILPQKIVINGKDDGFLPSISELTPDLVRSALDLPKNIALDVKIPILPKRLPKLCIGCPHIDSFQAINTVVSKYPETSVISDIGCYSLGVLPPLLTIDSLVCMGAAIGMAQGAREAGAKPIMAVIGDSTFVHSGITGLVDAIALNTDITIIILDNSTTAMTGGQNVQLSSDQLVDLIKGLGIEPDHLKVIIPIKSKHEQNVAVIEKEINYLGLSVIILKRECIKKIKVKKRISDEL